ncbi:MAG: NFACT RNA binding domain-containing protein, partial [Candidatus Diapherotrites archaeon]|nr:NFACT RNA binding domain-containing protein [Candidatus Diapherotrites archaeon]
MRIELNFLKSVDENAAAFFEKAKRQKKKVTGIKVASVSLSSRIQSADTAVSSVALPRSEKRRKREWFEKFRWFFSSDGFLVLGGRDAKSNEQLVKKFLDRDDLFVHADVFGAAHCVIKADKKPIPLSTKKEAAVFAAVFSRSWEAGSGKADVY